VRVVFKIQRYTKVYPKTYQHLCNLIKVRISLYSTSTIVASC